MLNNCRIPKWRMIDLCQIYLTLKESNYIIKYNLQKSKLNIGDLGKDQIDRLFWMMVIKI